MDVFEVDSTRFWAKVEKTDTCWNWTATKTRGYGMIRAKVNGKNRMVLAHRLSFAMEYGSVKSDKHIDHMCHNVSCVRPSHLRMVTNKQNSENVLTAQSNSKSGVRGVGWDKSRECGALASRTTGRPSMSVGMPLVTRRNTRQPIDVANCSRTATWT